MICENYKAERSDFTRQVKEKALDIGFDIVGIANAEPVDRATAEHYAQWLDQGCHPELGYMFRHKEKRGDPTLLFEPAQSLIIVGINYYYPTHTDRNQYRISSYALGKDYHLLIKSKLQELQTFLSEQQKHRSRIFCDTAPLLERYWGWKAGLGWIGKNNQLIIPSKGSYFFLGAILTELQLDQDTPLPHTCPKGCRLCMDACPSKALSRPFFLDTHRCLSYWTIENKGEIPPSISVLMKDYIYGCDECLKACPYNLQPMATKEPSFLPNPELLKMKKKDWAKLTETDFNRIFQNSSVFRIGYQRWMRNLQALLHSESFAKDNP